MVWSGSVGTVNPKSDHNFNIIVGRRVSSREASLKIIGHLVVHTKCQYENNMMEAQACSYTGPRLRPDLTRQQNL